MDKEQLKEAVGELPCVDTVFDPDGISYVDTAVSIMQVYDLIDQLDEPEKVVIPQFVADWIEEMKQDKRPFYSVMSTLMNKTNHEWAIWKSANMNFSEIVAQAWLDGYKVEEEQLYYALVKGHELTDSNKVYWVHDKNNGDMFIGILHSPSVYFLSEMSKSKWNKLGINDSNADFVKMEDC